MTSKERFRARLKLARTQRIFGVTFNRYMKDAANYLSDQYPQYAQYANANYYSAWLYQLSINDKLYNEIWQKDKRLGVLETIVKKLKSILDKA